MKVIIILSVAIIGCIAQRPFYAGLLPIGYPVIQTTTVASTGLGERFGNNSVTTTTEKLPIEARGDVNLVNRLKKIPVEHQPFWYLNRRALETQRNNPQSYPQRGNFFIDNWN